MKTRRRWVQLVSILVLGVGAGCSESSGPPAPDTQPDRARAQALSSSEPYLVRDINPLGQGSMPNSVAVINGTFFFAVTTSERLELWKSDGTAGGTSLVRDFFRESPPVRPISLTAVGTTLFFQDSNTGAWWTSDGTEAGTVKLSLPAASEGLAQGAAALNGRLLWLTSQGLWTSNGTTAGTLRVKELNNGRGPVAQVNGMFFFSANLPGGGRGMWKSDGTEAGTAPLEYSVAGSAASDIFGLIPASGQLYFYGQDASRAGGVWRTDGTPAGTLRLRTFTGFVQSPVASGGRLFFRTLPSAPGELNELWTSDGSVAGTVRVKAFNVSVVGPIPTGGGALFTLFQGATGHELWRTDGTEAGTVALRDLCAGSDTGGFNELITSGGVAFFTAGCEAEGTELWRSDGTAAGTVRVREILPGSRGSNPLQAVAVNGTVYFWAEDGTHGRELWKSDGTESGTALVRDVVPDKAGSEPRWLTALGDSLFFVAGTGNSEIALWKTDGTAEGTVSLLGLFSSINQVSDPLFTDVKGTLFFVRDSVSPSELWKSDGTLAGTVRVRQFPSASGSLRFTAMEALGGTAIMALRGSESIELWKSDGTEGGTVLLQRLASPISSTVASMAELNGKLYFPLGHNSNRHELWVTDGTAAGTARVKTIFEGEENFSAQVGPLVSMNGKLFFTSDGMRVGELWQSDGTAAGTSPATEFFTLPDPVQDIAAADGALYLLTNHGRKLWRGSGTAQATLVKELFPASEESSSFFNRRQLGRVRGQLHFTTYSTKQGWMLWKSNGTAEGTVLVRRLALGRGLAEQLSPFATFAEANKRLYFVEEGGQGRELWALPYAPFDCPGALVAEATGPGGAVVSLPNPQRAGDVDPALPISSSHAAGSQFPLGTTPVTLTASHPAYPATTCTFSVQVRDGTPPQVQCPGAVTVDSITEQGIAVEYPAATATDAVSTATLEYSQASGSTFPVGVTKVEVKATDAAGNTSSCTFDVNVAGPGGCGCGAASPSALLWWLLALVPVAARRRHSRKRGSEDGS